MGDVHSSTLSALYLLMGREGVVIGARGVSMTNVSRREAGVSNGMKPNSAAVAAVAVCLMGNMGVFAGVSAGMRFPFRFKRARGSIDLRRLWPPRGMRDVSTAYGASSNQRSSRSQLRGMGLAHWTECYRKNSCLGELTPGPILHQRIILRRWLHGLSLMSAYHHLYRRRA